MSKNDNGNKRDLSDRQIALLASISFGLCAGLLGAERYIMDTTSEPVTLRVTETVRYSCQSATGNGTSCDGVFKAEELTPLKKYDCRGRFSFSAITVAPQIEKGQTYKLMVYKPMFAPENECSVYDLKLL